MVWLAFSLLFLFPRFFSAVGLGTLQWFSYFHENECWGRDPRQGTEWTCPWWNLPRSLTLPTVSMLLRVVDQYLTEVFWWLGFSSLKISLASDQIWNKLPLLDMCLHYVPISAGIRQHCKPSAFKIRPAETSVWAWRLYLLSHWPWLCLSFPLVFLVCSSVHCSFLHFVSSILYYHWKNRFKCANNHLRNINFTLLSKSGSIHIHIVLFTFQRNGFLGYFIIVTVCAETISSIEMENDKCTEI